MVSSVDGKIDGSALSSVMADREDEATGAKLKGDAWICGCTTMQQHFAEKKPSRNLSETGRATARLRCSKSEVLRHLCRHAREASLAKRRPRRRPPHLRRQRTSPQQTTWTCSRKGATSFVVSGNRPSTQKGHGPPRQTFWNPHTAPRGRRAHQRRFLQAGLVDELSLGWPRHRRLRRHSSRFDGISDQRIKPYSLKMRSIERRKREILWLRYKVVRSKSPEK